MKETNLWEPEQFRKYYEYCLETDENIRLVDRTKNNYLYQEISFDQKDVVLDLGCGYGRISKKLAPNVKKIIGVDINQRNLQYAELYVNSPNFTTHCQNLRDFILPFPDQYFSRIILDNLVVFFNKDELNKLFSELDRLLIPGGYILFDFENSYYLLIPFVIMFEKLMSLSAKFKNKTLANKKRISLFSITRLFKEKNYNIESKGATIYYQFKIKKRNLLGMFKKVFVFIDEFSGDSIIKYVMSSILVRVQKKCS